MKITKPILLLWTCTALCGHEQTTHQRIGDAAVVYLNQVYLNATTPRPLLLGSIPALQKALQYGEWHEDDGFGSNLAGYNPYGRFIFHFFPDLTSTLQVSPTLSLTLSANGCRSVDWAQNSGGNGTVANGASGCEFSCSVSASGFMGITSALCNSVSGVPHFNAFRWDQDLTPDNAGAPSAAAINGFGYVVHLLEDLGSPAHTRNDLHPCPNQGFYTCNLFETINDNKVFAPFGDPQQLPGGVWSSFVNSTTNKQGSMTQVVSTSGFTTPTDFFNALQTYVRLNYYSNRTVVSGSVPTMQFSVGDYFYGPCITSSSGVAVSLIAGTCTPVVNPADGQTYAVRKIAHKPGPYWASCPNPVNAKLGISSEAGCDITKANIDQVIAREQFAELGPVIAQHVASFIKFYAPALSVQVQGIGTVTSSVGTGINCTGGSCSALFVQDALFQGAHVTLTATAGVTWGGDCSSGGTSPTVTLTFTADKNCTATFVSGCPAQAICGTVTDIETGTFALHGIFIELRSSTGSFLGQTTTDNSGKYVFSALAAPTYFVDPVLLPGQFPSPSLRVVSPGGQPANFSIGGVPASVSVTGPSGAFVLFTKQPITGPPPCQGSGCPVSITGVASFTFSIPNGTWWLTCYVSPGFAQTSNQQLAFAPQQSLTRSCPP